MLSDTKKWGLAAEHTMLSDYFALAEITIDPLKQVAVEGCEREPIQTSSARWELRGIQLASLSAS